MGKLKEHRQKRVTIKSKEVFEEEHKKRIEAETTLKNLINILKGVRL